MRRPRSSRTRSRARRSRARDRASPPGPTSSLTVSALLDEAAARLGAAGIATARLDAELLLRHVLGWDRASLIARAGEAVPPATAELFRSAIGGRARRPPLPHLTALQAFLPH